MMKKELSILIPTYNDRCYSLVEGLREQAEATGIRYEILVADDGSIDNNVVAENRRIEQWEHCHYLIQPKNIGRSAIRNLLTNKARYDWLLFVDSDMTIVRDDYIYKYVHNSLTEVIDGGVSISGDPNMLRGNLRYKYEKAEECNHTVEIRQRNPYQDFHTANFLVRRDLMLSHPFNERIRLYGYEDVLFGKELRKYGISIMHIDNPMGFCTFESNSEFVAKTEEGMRTLKSFRKELRGYSRIISIINGIHIPIILWFIRLEHHIFGKLIRSNLCGSHPNLQLFRLYKLGYFLSLKD